MCITKDLTFFLLKRRQRIDGNAADLIDQRRIKNIENMWAKE